MQLSDSLEVAIGLSFVFLLLSLIMTALQEAVESFLKVRGAHLFDGFIELLSDPEHPRPGPVKEHDNKGVAWFVRTWLRVWGFPTRAPAAAEDAVKALYEHPLIHGLYRGDFANAKKKNQLPSYVPSRNFALALIDQIIAARVDAAPTAGASLPPAATPAERLRLAAERIESEPLRRAVLQAVDLSAGDMERIQKNLEAWYDSGMDRVSGWYRRRTQMFLFFFGLTAAVVLNINALMIADSLAQNATLRRAVAASIETNLKKYDPDKDRAATAQAEADEKARLEALAAKALADEKAKQAAAGATPLPSAGATPDRAPAAGAPAKPDAALPAPAAASETTTDDANYVASQAIGELQNLGLPIGWGAAGRNAYTQAFASLDEHIVRTEAKAAKRRTLEADAKAKAAAQQGEPPAPPKAASAPSAMRPWYSLPHLGLYLTIGLGWLMTALAVTLGAPFWFDVLNRLVVIRATVKPHEKSREERSQDPQDKKADVSLEISAGKDGTQGAPRPVQAPASADAPSDVLDRLDSHWRPREGDEDEDEDHLPQEKRL